MSNVRWNFRLGPLQFTSPASLIGVTALAAVVLLCCCGAWVVGVVN